jgi:hypothetical protein
MAFWKLKTKTKTRRPSTASFPSKPSRSSTVSTTTHKDTTPSKPLIQQTSPLLSLPLELIQQIASYLDHSSAASLCLSSRYTCYAIGRNDLTEHLSLSCSLPRFQRRKNIEILERAFPSHWYCAWCDTFHRHDVDGGPTRYANEAKRDCAEFNSYLHDGSEYVVCYHHVRLALNRVLWGEEYGVGVEAFAYDEEFTRKSGKMVFGTRLKCRARILESRLILHASFRVTIPPSGYLRPDEFAKILTPILPHVVAGHRDSHAPHTGIQKRLENALAHGGVSKPQLCSVCATDFTIYYDTTATPHPTLKISVWRDLGNGRNPFDASWRAHGELGHGRPGFASDALRLASFQPGDIKKAFESGNRRFASGRPPAGMHRPDGKSLEESMSESWTQEIIQSRGKGDPVGGEVAGGSENDYSWWLRVMSSGIGRKEPADFRGRS